MFGNYRGQEGESIPAHRAARVSNFTDPSEDSTRSRPNRRQRQSSNAASEVSSSASSPERDTDAEFYMVQPNDSQSSIGVVPLHELNMKEKERRGPPINMLPSEILIAIFSKLSSPHDLRHCMLVSKTWAGHSVGLLWHRPVCNNMNTMINVAQTVSREHTFFKYEDLIKRLNLASQPLAKEVNDGTLEAMSGCKKIERLTLTGCQMITDSGIMALIDGNHYLLALDVSGIVGVTDATLLMAASNCKRLQGLNVTGNVEITDRSVIAIAEGCKHLKRVSIGDSICPLKTNQSTAQTQ
jgi:F-box and leucine-rich repeat protein GRR1